MEQGKRNARDFREFWLLPGGEPVLQVDVPELVDRACLSQYSALVGFLDDAHKRGVLRQAGAAYQFRHIDLQHRLATRS